MEEIFDQGDSTKYSLPTCLFSSFVVYFSHYLRYAEHHELSYYIHPFRFVATMSNILPSLRNSPRRPPNHLPQVPSQIGPVFDATGK